MSGAMELEHHTPADHVAKNTVGLSPVPRLAEDLREAPPAGVRVVRNELTDKGDVSVGNYSATISEYCLHGEGRVSQQNHERKPFPQLFPKIFDFLFGRSHLPPEGGGPRPCWIAVPKQSLKLMGIQGPLRLSASSPPHETSFRQPLFAKP